jgi:hypothetical protein
MPSDLEHRSFVAHDTDGSHYVVVGCRPVGKFLSIDRPGTWSFQTLDGRSVFPARAYYLYMVEPDGIGLTTSDPDEPND